MKTKKYPVSEQVGNLLNVLKTHEGQWVLGKNGVAVNSLNPLMSDGGIQPPGEPLYGPRIFNNREAAQAAVEKWRARASLRTPSERGIIQNPPGKKEGWWLWTFTPGNCHSLFSSQTEAEAQLAKDIANEAPENYCAVSAEEWVMQTTLHEKINGRYQTLREYLAAHPELAEHAKPEPNENMPENWVCTLAGDEPVDIVLNRKRDGISEDCFDTTAAQLMRSGFGQLSFERNTFGVTVYADTLDEFNRIQFACA